jgi:hypothetical protein
MRDYAVDDVAAAVFYSRWPWRLRPSFLRYRGVVTPRKAASR